MTFNDRTLNEVNIIWATPLCACAAVHRPHCPLSASDLCVTLTDSPALPDPRPCQLFYKTLKHSQSCRKSALLVVAQQREEVAVSLDVVEVGVAQSTMIPKEKTGKCGHRHLPRTRLTITTRRSCLSPLTACWLSSARKWSGSSPTASDRLHHSWPAPQVVYGNHSSHRMYVRCLPGMLWVDQSARVLAKLYIFVKKL